MGSRLRGGWGGVPGRSETHHCGVTHDRMGFAPLYPSYEAWLAFRLS